MKKIMTAIGAMFILLTGVFTSCDFSDFVAPTDQWVYKESSDSYSFSYEYNEKEVNFDIYVNYATKESTISFSGTEKTIEPGLNVILIPDLKTSDEGTLQELLNATNLDDICLFQSLGTSFEAGNTESDSDTGTKQSLTTTAWTIIYNLNKFDDYSDKQISNMTKNLTLAADTKISWKKVLYNMLGSKLLDE